MMRRVVRGAAACCIAVAALVAIAPTPSGAEAPQAVGWWSRQVPFQGGDVEGQSVGEPVRFSVAAPQQVPPVDTTEPGSGPITTAPLPAEPPGLPEPPITTPDSGEGSPNPSVPEGGLWVANDVTGASAISALRYRGNIGSGELKLTFAEGSTVLGPIVACPTLSDWTPGPAGAWRDRPAHDCDRLQLSGRTAVDGTGVSFAIPQGFTAFGQRVLDIVILPKPGAGDVFSLYFEAPDADSFEVFDGQSLPPPVTTLPDPEPASLPTTMPPTTARFTPGAASPTPVFDAPTTTETAAPVVTEIGGGGALPQPIADVLEPLTESRVARVFAVVLLLSMGMGLWWLGAQPGREPRLLGAMANAHPHAPPVPVDAARGIGRFRRARNEPPTRF